MPLLWGRTRCTEVAGWQDRIITKLTVAGGVGAVVGGLLSVVQQQPALRLTAISTASFLMLTGCFSVVQETSRLVHCRDSPTNSVLAGAATGALLYKSHGRAGAPGAVICGALAGGVHLVSARLNAAGGLQRMLIALDLLDPPPGWLEQQQRRREEEEAAAEAARRADEERTEPRPWWHHYLPLRKLSEAEWQKYKAEKDELQRKRIEAALAGGLPAMVERQQQQQQLEQEERQRLEGAAGSKD